MPRPKRVSKDKYGEAKQKYQLMLTESSSLELDRVSEKLRITRSEVLEIAIRQGLLKQVKSEPPNADD